MGLTLIRKRTGRVPKNARVALVLAGGAFTGGAFKVGGLQALDDFLVGRRVNELDIYVGLSAGSVLAVAVLTLVAVVMVGGGDAARANRRTGSGAGRP